MREEGQRGLWKGFGPTFVGYSLQGMFKYGLYEIFKDMYMNLAGGEASNKYKPAIWLAGSASADVFADIALCPLEMTKVKIQTFQPAPSQSPLARPSLRCRGPRSRRAILSALSFHCGLARCAYFLFLMILLGRHVDIGKTLDPIHDSQVLFL